MHEIFLMIFSQVSREDENDGRRHCHACVDQSIGSLGDEFSPLIRRGEVK